jgi:hypothetical protein
MPSSSSFCEVISSKFRYSKTSTLTKKSVLARLYMTRIPLNNFARSVAKIILYMCAFGNKILKFYV